MLNELKDCRGPLFCPRVNGNNISTRTTTGESEQLLLSFLLTDHIYRQEAPPRSGQIDQGHGAEQITTTDFFT